MADFRIFDTYVINYGTQGLPADAPVAFIDCYYQNTQVAKLQFYPTTTTFGVGGGYSGSIMILYFTIEQYKDAISILRHDSLCLFLTRHRGTGSSTQHKNRSVLWHRFRCLWRLTHTPSRDPRPNMGNRTGRPARCCRRRPSRSTPRC